MSGAPGIAPVEAVRDDLDQILTLLAAVDQSQPGGLGDLLGGLGGEDERDLLQLILLLDISRNIGNLGGGSTVVTGGDGGGAPQLIGLSNLIETLQADVVFSQLNQQAQASEDILDAPLVPTDESSVFRFTSAWDAGVVLSVTFDDGSDSNVVAFNEGGALTASALYAFDITGVHPDLSINFQVDQQATATVFVVKELNASAP